MQVEMRISVVIPAYNREETIVECLDSVVNQTYKPYEVIVVDDASSDNTVKAVENYPSDIVRVIRCSQNAGAQVARNIGIKESKGDWIAFQDSDDTWLPDKLERQKEAIEKSGFNVCAGAGIWKENGQEKVMMSGGKSGDAFGEALITKTYIMFQTLLVKKEILEQIGYLDEKVEAYQELDTGILITRANKLVYINQPLFVYNIQETMFDNKERGLRAITYLFQKHYDEIIATNGEKGLAIWYGKLADNCRKGSWLYYKYRCFRFVCKIKSYM